MAGALPLLIGGAGIAGGQYQGMKAREEGQRLLSGQKMIGGLLAGDAAMKSNPTPNYMDVGAMMQKRGITAPGGLSGAPAPAPQLGMGQARIDRNLIKLGADPLALVQNRMAANKPTFGEFDPTKDYGYRNPDGSLNITRAATPQDPKIPTTKFVYDRTMKDTRAATDEEIGQNPSNFTEPPPQQVAPQPPWNAAQIEADRKAELDEKKKKAERERSDAESAKNSIVDDLNGLKEAAANLKKMPIWKATGSIKSSVPNWMVDQDTANVRVKINELKSKLSVTSLQDMKARGLSTGTITESEWPRFESLVTSIDTIQDPKMLYEALTEIETFAEKAIGNTKSTFNKKFGDGQAGAWSIVEVP